MTSPSSTPDRDTPSTGGWCRRLLRCERGSGIVTALLLLPTLIVFAELITLGGRIAGAHADMNAAAREAARQASVSSGLSGAGAIIRPIALTTLADKGYQCSNPSARFGGATNYVPGGSVEVVVTCTVNASDLSLFSIPLGSLNFEGSAVEPIDTYRVVE